MNYRWNGSNVQSNMLKLWHKVDGTQTALAGTTSVNPAGFCANGTLGSSCDIVRITIGATYDTGSTPARWVIYDPYTASLKTISVGGNMNNLVGLPRGVSSYVYRRDGATEIAYYCSGGRLYKYQITAPAGETALSWPVASIQCQGPNLIYNSTRNSLIFPFKQNGLNGIVEYLNP